MQNVGIEEISLRPASRFAIKTVQTLYLKPSATVETLKVELPLNMLSIVCKDLRQKGILVITV